MDLRFEKYRGAAIRNVFVPLAELRIRVFRDFPYLYEGTLDYELEYLKTYAQSDRALLFAVYDGEKMVGATTCIPLADETPEVQEPFLKAGYNIAEVFYFGESILLPQYRGHGLGHRFFEEREAHAASFGAYRYTCFCAVERPDDHPLRPAGYRPLDDFWTQRGYRKAPGLVAQFSWPDVHETEPTAKNMIYWMKPLP
ncbi:MAG: GNAT family N-acetyltransferase [Saprospiraceae bacterium]|nr:GNAT family N-acetyltransferase [Saprospiraceae bacterium]